jgi:2-dehydro-3-deoxygluconokinase
MSVVTFGEALFRFSTRLGDRLKSTHRLDFFLGGTELNVAANLVSLGVAAEWVSCVPESDLGKMIEEKVADLKVGTHHLMRKPGRAGWYMHESGATPRSDIVIERQSSVMGVTAEFDFNWQKIFSARPRYFHTSGVSAGLSEASTQEVLKAMTAARANGTTVSYDFNYRKNLWSSIEAAKRQRPLLKCVDILFCSRQELTQYFDWNEADTSFSKVFSQGPFTHLVLSVRDANESTYGIDIVSKGKVYVSPRFPISQIDRIGVGDSMTAAVLAYLLEKRDLQEVAAFGAAAGALKYTVRGDMALLNSIEIERLVQTGYKGVIR